MYIYAILYVYISFYSEVAPYPNHIEIGIHMSQKKYDAARKRWKSLKHIRAMELFVSILLGLNNLGFLIYLISSITSATFNPIIAIIAVLFGIVLVAMLYALKKDYRTLTSPYTP